MSGPALPVRDALIVAHGQPSDPDPAEAALADFRAQVAARLPDWRVGSATLAAPGRLDSALDGLGPDPLIYPFFMADGWFVTQMLPRRLNGRGGDIVAPFGLDPGLPALTASALGRRIAAEGWRVDDVTLVLAAHGSGRAPGGPAAQAALAFERALTQHMPLRAIRTGFVEEDPSITAAASGCDARALCLPFFSSSGDHVTGDVPEALDAAGFSGLRLPSLGNFAAVPDLVAASLRQAAAQRERA